jgi:hypothetical protein
LLFRFPDDFLSFWSTISHMSKDKTDSQVPGAEIDISDFAQQLEAETEIPWNEECDHAESEGLSEDEALRRIATAISRHSYRDESRSVAPVPSGLRERMAARMGCPPDDVDKLLRINEADDRVSALRMAVEAELEVEAEALHTETEEGAAFTDDCLRQRFHAALDRGWVKGLQELENPTEG